MAGILNNKERMIDFIITNQGRRQMSDGRMRVEYASFTDIHTFYQASGSVEYDVTEDAGDRIFFEASDRHQDIIVPELEAGHSMQPFRSSDFSVEGRKIASGTFKLNNSGILNFSNVLTGSAIESISGKFLNSLTNNFKDHKILRTEDLFSSTTDFKLSAHTASFAITDTEKDFGEFFDPISSISNLPSIFASRRFSHLPNFRYMPPVNVKDKSPIGDYPNFTDLPGLGFHFSAEQFGLSDLMKSLENKQVLEVGFYDTSRENNIIAQIFDVNSSDNESGGLEKLTIIDFGEFLDNDPESPGKHIYYIGKIREDDQGAQTYMNIFTMVID